MNILTYFIAFISPVFQRDWPEEATRLTAVISDARGVLRPRDPNIPCPQSVLILSICCRESSHYGRLNMKYRTYMRHAGWTFPRKSSKSTILVRTWQYPNEAKSFCLKVVKTSHTHRTKLEQAGAVSSTNLIQALLAFALIGDQAAQYFSLSIQAPITDKEVLVSDTQRHNTTQKQLGQEEAKTYYHHFPSRTSSVISLPGWPWLNTRKWRTNYLERYKMY